MPTPSEIKKLEGVLNPLVKQRYLKYFQLPQDIRQIMFAVETADKIREISIKNGLKKDRIWQVSYVVGLILLGETNIVNFVKTLKEKCKLNEESARQLARDINQAIFLPAKESLKQIHNIDQWPREDETENQSAEPNLNGNIVNLKNQ